MFKHSKVKNNKGFVIANDLQGVKAAPLHPCNCGTKASMPVAIYIINRLRANRTLACRHKTGCFEKGGHVAIAPRNDWNGRLNKT